MFFVVYDLVRLATGFDLKIEVIRLLKYKGLLIVITAREGPREVVCKKFPFRDLAFAGALAGGSTH